MSKLQRSWRPEQDDAERKDTALMLFLQAKSAVDELEARLSPDNYSEYLHRVDVLEDARFYYIYCCREDIAGMLD